MKHFEAIPNRHYRHVSGRTASVYGAHPATSAADFGNWSVVQNGWTIRDNVEGRVGGFQSVPPGSSEDHAKSIADNLNNMDRMRYARTGHVYPYD